MNKNIFSDLFSDIIKNLKIGDVLSGYDSQRHIRINGQGIKDMIYLGENIDESRRANGNTKSIGGIQRYKVLSFLIFLSNNETALWDILDSVLKDYIGRGWFKVTSRKHIPPELLNEIRLPREKEAVRIVSEETKIQLPDNIKNQLLVALGQSEGKDYFSSTKQRENENQEAGVKTPKKQKTKKSIKRKNKKSKKVVSNKAKKTKKYNKK